MGSLLFLNMTFSYCCARTVHLNEAHFFIVKTPWSAAKAALTRTSPSMSTLFEPGPWDNQEKTESAHVFSKKRKLMYGDDHDHGEEESYGKKELNKLYPIWRRSALKYMQGLCARTTGEVRMPRKMPKWNHKEGSQHVTGWPGDLGKDYALVEELVQLEVFSIQQASDDTVHGVIHRGNLQRAIQTYCIEEKRAVPATVTAAASSGPVPAFEAASSFGGARDRMVFRLGEQGLGYYRDGATPERELPPLPQDWTEGLSPEGYAYYWHRPTSNSAWERPTAATTLTQVVPLSAAAFAVVRGAGTTVLRKVQDQSGAVVTLKAGQVVVSGTARAIEQAAALLTRKAEGLVYAAGALATQRPAPSQPAKPDTSWDFRAVVTAHDAAAAASGGGGGGGKSDVLTALAAYGDDDDDDDGEADGGGA